MWLSLQVGINKGDGVQYYEHPLSRDPTVLHLNAQTNTGVTGRWLYRVDGRGNGSCFLPLPVGKYNVQHGDLHGNEDQGNAAEPMENPAETIEIPCCWKLKAPTHAAEIGAINWTPDSGASFSCRLHLARKKLAPVYGVKIDNGRRPRRSCYHLIVIITQFNTKHKAYFATKKLLVIQFCHTTLFYNLKTKIS